MIEIAQTGLAFDPNPHDRERYDKPREIAEMTVDHAALLPAFEAR